MDSGSTVAHPYHPWTAYMWAREEARSRGDRRTGTDHLVLALLEDPTVEAVLGVSLQEARDCVDSLDREALGALGLAEGVDAPPLGMLPVPERPTFKAVVKDRIRMTPVAKRVLEEAGKPMRRGKQITALDVLRRILDLEAPDPAAALLRALGIDVDEVRARIEREAPTG